MEFDLTEVGNGIRACLDDTLPEETVQILDAVPDLIKFYLCEMYCPGFSRKYGCDMGCDKHSPEQDTIPDPEMSCEIFQG